MDAPNYKRNLVIRSQMRKTNHRDLIYMTHLSHDRMTSGRFKSEYDHKQYHFRHFRELETLWKTHLDKVIEEAPKPRSVMS